MFPRNFPSFSILFTNYVTCNHQDNFEATVPHNKSIAKPKSSQGTPFSCGAVLPRGLVATINTDAQLPRTTRSLSGLLCRCPKGAVVGKQKFPLSVIVFSSDVHPCNTTSGLPRNKRGGHGRPFFVLTKVNRG